MPGASSVSAAFWIGSGSREEDGASYGASHFLEHLAFKGTARRSGPEIARSMDQRGGEMNAFTAQEHTVFYLRLLGEALDFGIDLLCDIITEPALATSDIDLERDVILDEILMHADDPADVVAEAASSALFGAHPLGRDVLGTAESIAGMDPGSIRGFFGTHYRPTNMVFAAAGALNHDQVLAGLEPWMGHGGGQRPRREPPVESQERFVLIERPTEQAHVVVAWRAPSAGASERLAMEVLDHIIGGGMSSRLFQEVRERRGLAYSVGSEWQQYSDAGSLFLYAATAPTRAAHVREVLLEQASALVEKGVTEEEVAAAKEHLRAAQLLGLEEPAARMGRLGREQLLLGRVEPLEQRLASLERVSAAEVSELASAVLAAEPSVAAVGPFSGEDLVQRNRRGKKGGSHERS